MEKQAEAVRQLKAKDGPIYAKWRRNYLNAMMGVIAMLEKEM